MNLVERKKKFLDSYQKEKCERFSQLLNLIVMINLCIACNITCTLEHTYISKRLKYQTGE